MPLKHDPNQAIKKSNINVLQAYEDTRLYVSPHYAVARPASPTHESASPKAADICSSARLTRKHHVRLVNSEAPASKSADAGEIGVRDLVSHMVDRLAALNVSQWFTAEPPKTR
jgi:hypothetical protein